MLQEAEAEMSAERQGGAVGQIGQAMREAVEMPPAAEFGSAHHERTEMMTELRSMKGLIEERFATLAFMERLQRQPGRAALSQRLLDCGFSPSLVRKLVDKLPDDVEPTAWASGVLERNLVTGEAGEALEDEGGVFALVGTTGVGKTTSTAKLAAAFATKYGASNLGLITRMPIGWGRTSSCAPTAASWAYRCTSHRTAPRWRICWSCWPASGWCSSTPPASRSAMRAGVNSCRCSRILRSASCSSSTRLRRARRSRMW
jgi:flagellar biosynthesis protein FlhF